MNAPSRALQAARQAYDLAHYGGASIEAENVALRELIAAEDAANPLLKAKRLRLEAYDFRKRYADNMAEYGREIGRSLTIKDPTVATLVRSAANAALDVANDCLTRAFACEAEADRIDPGQFVTLFDGVSSRLPSAQAGRG